MTSAPRDHEHGKTEWTGGGGRSPRTHVPAPDTRAVDQTNELWDVVDEASSESFPASDPPSWTSGTHVK